MVPGLRRNQGSWQRLRGKPSRERHYVALVFNILTMLSLGVAVGLPWWSTGEDLRCFYEFGLGVAKTYPKDNQEDINSYTLSQFYDQTQQVVIACIYCMLSITMILQLISTIISAGYPREKLEFLRHFSVFNIVSLICIVTACGFWLWVTEGIPRMQALKRCAGSDSLTNVPQNGASLVIYFHSGFYVSTMSGVFCLVALSVNIICAKSAADRRRRERQRLRRREQNFSSFVTQNIEMSENIAPPNEEETPLPLTDTEPSLTTDIETTDAEDDMDPPPYVP